MAPRDAILALQTAMNAEVLGQPQVIERMVIGLLADGHLLIEGLPGLAKTRAVKAMAKHLKADFSRIQFTPDLLPSDVTGTDIYYSEGGKGEFRFQPGPVFGNLLLADEINRAPAKVQAALLEAMEERQVTVGQATHPLPDLFMVLATQNPIEQEGTYPLPEAQTDRFLMKVLVDYPAPPDELGVLRLVRSEEQAALAPKPAEEAAGEAREPRPSPSTTSSPPAARSPRSTSPRRSRPTSSTSSTRPATRPSIPRTSAARSSSAPAPAPASPSTAAAAPMPGSRARTSSPPATSRPSPPTSSATASPSPTRPEAPAATPTPCSPT